MTYLVTDAHINSKYQDCIEVCPVDCFYEGENMVVINTRECIDCAVCEPECPVDAIIPDTDPGADKWMPLNQKYAEVWPNITKKGTPPDEADDWADKPDKFSLFSENPSVG